MKKLKLNEIKGRLRAGAWAWPGGYPLYFLCADGEALSFADVRANWREIVGAHIGSRRDPEWTLVGCEINWEDPELYSAHSGERIESAYAEED